MTVVAIIQARMGSTRLPGKVALQLGHMSVLEHVIQRIRRATSVETIVVATTRNPLDDQIVAITKKANVKVFRGDEFDVLNRYHQCAEKFSASTVVRITADCPFIDPKLLDQMLEKYNHVCPDYLSNTIERTYPKGLDIEIFPAAILAKTAESATDPYDREHVTPYIYRRPNVFNLYSYRQDIDHSHYRITLDTPDDWRIIATIYDHCGNVELLETSKIIRCYDNINTHSTV